MESPSSARHSIGVVARRTGLKPDLIRAWERRYGVVEPSRSRGRHRLYSDAEVERLSLLKRAVDGGRSIGTLAERSNRELEELIAADAAATEPPSSRAPVAAGFEGASSAAAILSACLEAVRKLDSPTLQAVLERGAVVLSRSDLLLEVVVPLMRRVGELWHEGAIRPVHEHLASSVVRTFVGGLAVARPPDSSAPLLVVTTPAGQRHELGALIVASSAREEGWEVLYLGADLPAEEIAGAVLASRARAVALSITFPPDDPHLRSELERLGRLLPAGTPLLVGGSSAAGYADSLERAGARRLEGVPALRRELGRLRTP